MERKHRSRSWLRERDSRPARRPGSGRAGAWVPREIGQRFRAAPNTPDGRATTSGRVLIVDDETAIRLVCRLNLVSAGFETLEASDGASALALARTEAPDLILLDIMLPDVDGWQVAEELAKEPKTREIPILFLSARSERADERRGHGLGGVGYVTKPFDPSELTETVRHVLERVRLGRREELRREWERALGEG